MASFLHPVGPLPPSVYWRRRAIVLGVPLVLILALAYSCGGPSSKPAAHATATPPTSTPSTGAGVIAPSVMPTGSPGPGNYYPPVGPTSQSPGGNSTSSPGAGSSSGSNSNSGTTGNGGSTAASGDCALSLTLALDRSGSNGSATYPAGQDPEFIVTAKNNGTGNCVLDVSGKGIVITVTEPGVSGTVWASSTCAGATDDRALGPGGSSGNTYQATTTWKRTRSVSNCPLTPPSAGTGTFVVTATADGVTAASVQFVLQ